MENEKGFEYFSIFSLKIYIFNLKIRICSLKICIFRLNIEKGSYVSNFFQGVWKFTSVSIPFCTVLFLEKYGGNLFFINIQLKICQVSNFSYIAAEKHKGSLIYDKRKV